MGNRLTRNATTYTYDAADQMLTAGGVSYGYDANGNLTTVTDVKGGTITFQYSGHLLTQGTDANGHIFVRNTYDSKGRVTQQIDALGGVTTFAYSTPGDGATRMTDQRGTQTTFFILRLGRKSRPLSEDSSSLTRGSVIAIFSTSLY